MAIANGKGNGGVSHLDRLLSEKSPEFQAKVLRFALDSGMKQDDPAFRLVQYIGYLAQLTETAPNDWKLLFENLQVELNQWSQLTAEQLKTQADHTENIKSLATSCNQLATALSALNATSLQQLELLKNLTNLSNYWSNTSPNHTEKLIAPLREELKQMKSMISSHQLSHSAAVDLAAKNWAASAFVSLFTPVTFFILFTIYSRFFPLSLPYEAQTSLERIVEQTGWTNTKLKRVERNLGTDPNQRRRR
ncbi:hypothetical protein H6G64_31250 [Calothrix sp. FACHB-156]|nr:hypothetical protein [Calothrix sp. FACHB-156]